MKTLQETRESDAMSFVSETKNVFKNTGLHFRTGVSYMLPFLLIGGFIGSLASLGGLVSKARIWSVLKQIGDIGVSYFIVVMAAYIAYSIASNAGIAPGLIIGFLAKQTEVGYLGAVLGGILVGYATRMLMQVKMPQLLRSTWGMIAPVFGTLVVALLLVFMIGVPVTWMMQKIKEFLFSLESRGSAALGAAMGVLGGLDFGGPLSKVQSTFATAVMDMKIYTPLGITGAFVTVPPLGMCLGVRLAPHLYTENERTYAKQSWLYALIGGFTEIVIPLAAGDLLRVTIASVCGCVVTGVIAGWFSLKLFTPVLGLPQWFFYDQPLIYWMSLLPGVLTVAVIANTLKRWGKRPLPSQSSGEIKTVQVKDVKIAIITSCMAGVAQSHMAALALKREAEKRGLQVFTEEQGGHKVSNRMRDEDIAKADVVIFAKAISIAEKERFDGKKIVELPVNKALVNPKKAIDEALKLLN